MKYPKPKVFKPTKREVLEALNKVSDHLSPEKVICSKDFPELKVRGKRKLSHFILILLLLPGFEVMSQNVFPDYVSSTVPADSRYEIVQSNVAARLTLKIDRYTGDTYLLVEDTKEKILFWSLMIKLKHTGDDLSLSNINKVNYQFFTSGMGIRFTFLMNINTGATWQLALDKNEEYLWDPMF